jgi:hypothetical protein
MMRATLFLLLGLLGLPWQMLSAQTIHPLTLRSCSPGQATVLTISGSDLPADLRCHATQTGVTVAVDNIQPHEAQLHISILPDAPQGPFTLLFAGPASLLKSTTMFIDSLPAMADHGQNHTRESAQAIEGGRASITGYGDGTQSDFYRFEARAGQKMSFEVLTQALRSPMDPVLRLTNAAGETLAFVDDGATGPEPKFTVMFEADGDYWLEVHDSRYAAQGAEYQLRIGDFPSLTSCYPLAMQRGSSGELGFVGADAAETGNASLSVPKLVTETILIPAQGRRTTASWLPVATSRYRQIVEEDAAGISPGLTLPLGISGRLLEPGEQDVYTLVGEKERSYRYRTRTRSLGSSALLHMKLLDPMGKQVAATAVDSSDEWAFEHTFTESGEYRLEVSDLLRRGGDDFTYWIEIAPADTVTVALKADAAAREDFILQPESGALAVDLTINRFGYAGPLEVQLLPPSESLKILNPAILEGANEARLYIRATADWEPTELMSVQLVVQPSQEGLAADAGLPIVVDSRSLRRAKLPHILAPLAWDDGMLSLIGSAAEGALMTFEPAAPVRFARPVPQRQAQFIIKRLREGFTGAAQVLPFGLPDDWSLAASHEQDTYTLSFTGAAEAGVPFDTIDFHAYAEHAGRGQLLKTSLPVEWYDPLHVELASIHSAVAGGSWKLRASLKRDGDRQAVTLSLAAPQDGVTLPAEITIPADQDQAEFSLELAPHLHGPISIQLTAASQHAGQAYTVACQPLDAVVMAPPIELFVFPSEVQLNDAHAEQQLVVTGIDHEGRTRDWTHLASLSPESPQIATTSGTRVLPKADGKTTLRVAVGSSIVTVPVSVSHAEWSRPVAFEAEALVALSKQGCNSGACHGSPSGKGNFRLSLRAFDAQLDELTLIREEFGRRVNVFDPDASLLLQKPLMKATHGGGRQLLKSDTAYEVLRRWILEGAHADTPGTPRVVRLEVFPTQKRVLSVADGGQQLAITAHFADGTQRDVTRLAAYETSNTSVAVVDVHGMVTPRGRGEAAILVRFLEHIESLPLMFIDQVEGFDWRAPAASNYIDELVHEKLKQLQFLPGEVCSDSEFLRRAYLDLIGIPPTVEETREYLQDSGQDKRQRLVDRLLTRDEFAKFWALKWGDLLRMTSKLVGDEGIFKYHRWVEEALRENMPYDEFARQLITASGSTLSNPPANFYRTATDMNECVENISQVFLGARLQCAKCHNHPFERWTQDNYYGLGAFFNRVQRRSTERPGESFVYSGFSGEVTQPRTGEILKPWLPETGSIDPPAEEDRRLSFAQWLVQPDNPYFARMEVNRIWSQFFARGIVDPIDDFRDSNPPSNARLLDALAADFAAHGFDRKRLIRTIMASHTYQAVSRSNEWNREDSLYGSYQQPRLLTAEQLLDSINQALGLEENFSNLPPSTKATQLPAPDLVKVDFLKTFGQPERSTVCACERGDDSNLSMAIELFNGPMIHGKLRDENNRFRKALAAGVKTAQVIEEMYLAALCRFPTADERMTALAYCQRHEDQSAAIEDLCWALFNSEEFLFQH